MPFFPVGSLVLAAIQPLSRYVHVDDDGNRIPDAVDNMHIAACTAEALKVKIKDLQDQLESLKQEVNGKATEKKTVEAELAAANAMLCKAQGLTAVEHERVACLS